MDTASLIGVIGSFDVGSLVPPVGGLVPILDSIFAGISGVINLVVLSSAGVAGSIQTVLGSIAGQ